jgi:hypothetical protein
MPGSFKWSPSLTFPETIVTYRNSFHEGIKSRLKLGKFAIILCGIHVSFLTVFAQKCNDKDIQNYNLPVVLYGLRFDCSH